MDGSALPLGFVQNEKPLVKLDLKLRKGQSGIRTRGTRITLYTGLANQRLQPLGHLSKAPSFVSKQCSEVGLIRFFNYCKMKGA